MDVCRGVGPVWAKLFTSTKVPKFAGVTSWEQYCLMSLFDLMDGTTPRLPSTCYLIWRVMP